jgi:formylglycine-generating enzyme required for sulfatase activity
MKYIFPFVIISLLSFTSHKKEFVPPGTVKYNDTLFADETEISNFSWKEYELWTRTKYGKYSPQHLAVLPDTLVWVHKKIGYEPFTSLYYWHPAFRDYPVVGISYEQALEFCKWRTEMARMFLAKKGKNTLVEFEYRLPSKKEWETLSYNGRFEFSNNGYTEGKHKQAKMNLVRKESDTLGIASAGSDNAYVTSPVYSYWKNFFGLYNMIGNVSEMVLEKGVSKGGSWKHKLEECRVGNDIAYSKPENWLGFRCVCVVKKK